MTKAFITGITGCVGSNLAAALLRQGVEVVGLCQPGASTRAIEKMKITRVSGDLGDYEGLCRAMQGVDWVFHVAAIADDWKHPAVRIYTVNTFGSENVLTAALKTGVRRFVLTSSTASLGVPRPEKALMDEGCAFNLRPSDWTYAHSKLLAEEALRRAVDLGLEACAVLPSAILGPADSSQISGQLILRACRGEVFPFPLGGVNFIDVRDVAEAQIQAALVGKPGERYLLGGHNLSHLHCLGTMADVLGVAVRYVHVPAAAIPLMAAAVGAARGLGFAVPIDRQRVLMSREYMYYDNSKAVRELNLRPRPFDETVEAAYRWYVDEGVIPAALPAAVQLADAAA